MSCLRLLLQSIRVMPSLQCLVVPFNRTVVTQAPMHIVCPFLGERICHVTFIAAIKSDEAVIARYIKRDVYQ